MITHMDKQSISIDQAASLLGVSDITVRRYIKRLLKTDKQAGKFIVRGPAGYAIDRDYLLTKHGDQAAQAQTTQMTSQGSNDLVTALQAQVDLLTKQLAMKDEQLERKDKHIDSMLVREHEVNVLFGRSQGVQLLEDGQVVVSPQASDKKRRGWLRRRTVA